jgi:hypothetical protein
MMKQIKYGFVLEAREPIAHHSETQGNVSLIQRSKVRMKDGTFKRIPYLTGDTMRHQLREAIALSYIHAAEIGADLSEGALRLLFAGGMLTGRGTGGDVVKIDDYHRMVKVFPQLSLLGGCVGNRCVPGKLSVSQAQLICEETLHYLPPEVMGWLREEGQQIETHRAYVEETQRVRMDPTLDPAKRLLLSDDSRKQLEGRLKKSETAHEIDDAKLRDDSKSTMMPRSFERIVQGSLFFWQVSALVQTELDEDTLNVMIATFLANASVGGKRGSGHGGLRCLKAFDYRWEIARQEAVPMPGDMVVRGEVGSVFFRHVKEQAAEIKAFLRDVNA